VLPASTGASGIPVIGAPGETLVGETLVTAESLRGNSRNFRKRYANQDGGDVPAQQRQHSRRRLHGRKVQARLAICAFSGL
jgi:hypothetical protein